MDPMNKKDPRNDDVRSRIQDRIALLCKEKGLSQTKLADELGIERQTVSKWLTRRNQVPSEFNMLKVAERFGVSVSYLFGETDDRGPARNWRNTEGVTSEWFAITEEAETKLAEVLALLKKASLAKRFMTDAQGVSTEAPSRLALVEGGKE